MRNNLFKLRVRGKEALDFYLTPKVNKMQKLPFNKSQISKMHAIEELRKNKNDPYRIIMPVVVFASSNEERDTFEPYIPRTQCLPIKPLEPGQIH